MPADMFLLLVILIMYHVLGHSYVHLQSGHADMYSTIRLIRVESDVCKSVLMRFILWHLAFLGTRVKKQQNTYFFQPFRVEKIPTFGNVAFDWAVGDSWMNGILIENEINSAETGSVLHSYVLSML